MWPDEKQGDLFHLDIKRWLAHPPQNPLRHVMSHYFPCHRFQTIQWRPKATELRLYREDILSLSRFTIFSTAPFHFIWLFRINIGPEPASAVLQAAVKERKDEAYFVQSFHVRHKWRINRRCFLKGSPIVHLWTFSCRESRLWSCAFKTAHWILGMGSRPL